MKKFLIVLLVLAIIAGGAFLIWKNQNKGPVYPTFSGNSGEVTTETDPDTGEKIYYISGVWIWNEELAYPSFEDVFVNMSSAGENFVGIDYWEYAKDEGWFELCYGTTLVVAGEFSGFNGKTAYSNHDSGWVSALYRLVDFGGKKQQISKDFYDYLMANAVSAEQSSFDDVVNEQKELDKVYQVSGIWKWNSIVSVPDNVTHRISCEVPFVSYGIKCESFGVAPLTTYDGFSGMRLYFREEGSQDMLFVCSGAEGSEHNTDSTDLYLMDFGSEPVDIPSEGYHYLLANATRIGDSKPLDSAEEQYLPISGVWKWNDTLEFSSVRIKLEYQFFLSDGEEFTGFEVNGSTLHYERILTDGAFADGLHYGPPASRTMDFGSDPVMIPVSVHRYILANATQISEASDYTGSQKFEVSGKWKWHDNPTPPEETIYLDGWFEYSANRGNHDSITIGSDGVIYYGHYIESILDNWGIDFVAMHGYCPHVEVEDPCYNLEEQRYMDFGQNPQSVPKVFYDYLIANADPITE